VLPAPPAVGTSPEGTGLRLGTPLRLEIGRELPGRGSDWPRGRGVRRAPVVVSATVAGFAGVLAFRSHPATTIDAGSRAAGQSTSSGRPGSASPSSPVGRPGSGPSRAGRTGGSPGTSSARSATGPLENYGYGALSVRVTTRGRRITGLTVVDLQTAEPYSASLAAQVIPVLAREVLRAQGTRIAAVSGATYTSEAYAASVQAALDRLGA
jgi:hypothetical protein